MMTVITHVLDRSGFCARCGDDLTPKATVGGFNISRLKRGDRIGVISGLRFTPDSAYRITKPEFDSNKFCVPVLADSIP